MNIEFEPSIPCVDISRALFSVGLKVINKNGNYHVTRTRRPREVQIPGRLLLECPVGKDGHQSAVEVHITAQESDNECVGAWIDISRAKYNLLSFLGWCQYQDAVFALDIDTFECDLPMDPETLKIDKGRLYITDSECLDMLGREIRRESS